MSERDRTVLVIGYGNPGRRDDGLGPALAAAVAAIGLDTVSVDSDYQLQVELAADIARHDVVVFADAHVSCDDPFVFYRLRPSADIIVSSHRVSPATLLALARHSFDACPAGYVLGIRGHEFNEFGEWLSAKASANLAAAIEFIQPRLRKRDFDSFASGPPTASTCGAA
jgi:hydrogenase maturation protease